MEEMELTFKEKRVRRLLRLYAIFSISLWMACNAIMVHAGSLDDLIEKQEMELQVGQSNENTEDIAAPNVQVEVDQQIQENQSEVKQNKIPVSSDDYIEKLGEDTKLDTYDPRVEKVNSVLNKVISMIVQIMAYGITALLTLRVILDLAYIALPFARGLLNKENRQVAVANNNAMNPMAAGMNPMGSPMGQMGPMGGGFGGSPMGAPMGGQPQMNQPAPQNIGGTQLISNAAIRAVQEEINGKSPYKTYVSDMTVLLVAVPVLLILAMSGALTQFGLVLGQALVKLISSLSGMI